MELRTKVILELEGSLEYQVRTPPEVALHDVLVLVLQVRNLELQSSRTGRGKLPQSLLEWHLPRQRWPLVP